MNKRLKVIITAIIAFAVIGLCSAVNAATASISVSSSSVNVGDKVTATVSINAATWNLATLRPGL